MPPKAARKIAGARKPAKPRAAVDPSKPEEPKDLIYVRNILNNKVYKLRSATCISGHRAPKCPPTRHRDKILFRRPEPGRPSRQCGHAKPSICDCTASRNLCCNLTPQQWDEVIAGQVPSAVMYEDREALQQAERAAEQAAMMEAQAREHTQAMFAYQQQQHAMPFRPAPHGIQFGYPEAATLFNPYPPYQPPPPYQPAFFGSQPTQTNFEQPQYQPQYQQFEQPPPQPAFFGSQPAPVNFGHPQYVHQYQDAPMPVNMQALEQYAADMGRQEQIAAQPSTNPSQSCCSRKQTQPPPPSFIGTEPSPFNLPGPSPRSQFPCQSCASFQCTCITCPEVRQVSSGAWQQSCGRGGHIDNVVLPKQEYPSEPEEPAAYENGLQRYEQHIQQPIPDIQQPAMDIQQHIPSNQEHTLHVQQYATPGHFDQTFESFFDDTSVDFPPLPDIDPSQFQSGGFEHATNMHLEGRMPNQISDLTATISQDLPFEDLADAFPLSPDFFQQKMNQQGKQ
ncbi:unnamed protein product, partial [Aureobasidium uvarum]